MVIALVVIMNTFAGCARKDNSVEILKAAEMSPLEAARFSYENGEYYKSRVQVQKILEADPDNTAAQQLMADVLDKEIARQKESVIVSGASIKTSEAEDENEINATEVKNWLERSKTLLHQRQYDLALFAAEKVFIYDSQNREASLLIDDIKEEAIKNGKAESLFLSKMYQEEIGERVRKYRVEAQALVEQDKAEQAKFTVQKILLLEPEDPEALALWQELQTEKAAA